MVSTQIVNTTTSDAGNMADPPGVHERGHDLLPTLHLLGPLWGLRGPHLQVSYHQEILSGQFFFAVCVYFMSD